MRRTAFSNVFVSATLCALTLVPIATSAASNFEGPAGWSKRDIASPTSNRVIAQWHIAGDTSTSLTFIEDSSVTYFDTMTAMTKNFGDNAIKLAVNRDLPCAGSTAHEVEFTSGPEGSRTIFNRLVLAEGTGVATLTYTRADGNAFDADVRKAETAFCAGTLDPATFPPPPVAGPPTAVPSTSNAAPANAAPANAAPAPAPSAT